MRGLLAVSVWVAAPAIAPAHQSAVNARASPEADAEVLEASPTLEVAK